MSFNKIMNPNLLSSVLLAIGKDSYSLDDKELCNILRDIQKGDNSVKWFIPDSDDIIFPSKSHYLRSPLRHKHLREEQALDRAISNEKKSIAQDSLKQEAIHYQAMIKAGFPADVAAHFCKDSASVAKFYELKK
jgi:hypothetical protein